MYFIYIEKDPPVFKATVGKGNNITGFLSSELIRYSGHSTISRNDPLDLESNSPSNFGEYWTNYWYIPIGNEGYFFFLSDYGFKF